MLRILPVLFLSLFPFFHTNAQTELTALTYNLRFDNPGDGDDAWPKRRDFLAGQLRFHAPDVFGVQEALLRQLEYLDEQLPVYGRVGVGRDDGKEGGEYSALYYRKDRFGLLESGTFWLSTTPDVPSKAWDAALPRICTFAHLYDSVTNRKIWIFNTHFDHIGKQARSASASLILQKVKEKNTEPEPVIVMGDLNAEPGEAPVAVLDSELDDARAVSKEPAFGPEGTFNGFKFHEPVTRRIDYIFLKGKGLTVRQYAVLSDSRACHYPSDHLPVLARLRFE